MKTKKITFFIQDMYSTGGTERAVSLIANRLAEEYEVEIISLYRKNERVFYQMNPKIKVKNILEKELLPIQIYYPYLYMVTKNFFKDYKTDVFICAGMGMVGLTIYMRKKAKYLAWEHFNTLHGKVGGVMWLGRVLSAQYANGVITLTKKDMELFTKRFKPKAKVYQIYNPIEMTKISDDYDGKSKLILTVGWINKQKGFDMLVEVARRVFSKHPDWEWHIYGNGPMQKKIESLITKYSLNNNLKLMGRTNKMNELYKKYAMYVMTSRFEGFAMVNIEAHYARLPIISFNCNCGPDEIIQDGVNGYLVRCFDIDMMANKINYLIENPNVRIDMSSNTLLDKDKLQLENIIFKWKKIIFS